MRGRTHHNLGVLAFTGQASGIYRSVQLSPHYLQYAYQLPAISNVFWLNPFHRLALLARPKGFEPLTPGSVDQCSIPLS